MKNNLRIVLILFLYANIIAAQEHKLLSLKEAISIAVANSNEALLSNTKVSTAKLEMETMKNNQYPNIKASGQWLQLTQADVNSKLNSSNSSSGSSYFPEVEQLILGQISANMPVFNGFKLKNSIAASEKLYEAAKFNNKHSNEQIGLRIVELFSNLYKSQQLQQLLEDNLKSAQQRVKDFQAMEDNGLLAHNDLLKAQLQESNTQLALETAKKNITVINYELTTILKFPENTIIDIDIENVKKEMSANQNTAFSGNRNDLAALQLQQEASEKAIKVAQSNYYPSVSLIGGYIAFNLKNVLEVSNAMNIGVGLSYDLSNIFKNKKEVKLAESRYQEIKQSTSILNDRIKEENHEAEENYKLSLRQSLVYDKAVEQASENYRILKDKFDNGLATTNDLLEGDVEELKAKINQALSKADIAQKYYELQYASGKLLSSLNIVQN